MIKKHISVSLLIFLVLCLNVGCSNTIPKDSYSAHISSEPTEETIVADTETFSETVDVKAVSEPDISHTETEPDSKTVLWEAPNREILYVEDGVREEGTIIFDKAVFRLSNGIYYDSLCKPEMFSESNFLGDKHKFDESEFVFVQSGDTINGYTVEQARLIFNGSEKTFLSNSILFKDNVTLTGRIRYYNYDDPTAIQKGDIMFIPDSSYENMPLVQLVDYGGVIKDNDFPMVYSDSMWIPLGNLFKDYADNEEVCGILNNGVDSMELTAEVIIGELFLIFAGEMGTAATSGKIISINEII